MLFKEQLAKKISLVLVGFAAGSFLGAAFFDLLPEALEMKNHDQIFPFVILGIFTLLIFEKVLKWHHCHDREVCDFPVLSKSVIFGDAVHNFIDGLIISFSFAISFSAGAISALAVFLHEVPQEIGDFSVLLHAGYKKNKVILYNILTALTTLIGAITGYFFLPLTSAILPQIISFAAGIFIYIAVADLIPELRHKIRGSEFTHYFAIAVGLAAVWFLTKFFE